MLTTDKKVRKEMPIARGVVDYFPDALAAVANVSYVGNKQHNGEDSPLHWARGKSDDHADCIVRHLIERGTIDSDGLRHSAKLAWRALANLQIEIEKDRDAKSLPMAGMAAPTGPVGYATYAAVDRLVPLKPISRGRWVYISGPMRGIKEFNFPEFDKARDHLTGLRYIVTSPADLDRDGKSFEPDGSAKPTDFYAERDMQALITIARSGCKPMMYMLKGWEKSFGARAEKAIAEWLGFEVMYQE